MTKPPVFSTGRLMMSITPIQLNTAAHTKFAARGSGPLSVQCFVMGDKLAQNAERGPSPGMVFIESTVLDVMAEDVVHLSGRHPPIPVDRPLIELA